MTKDLEVLRRAYLQGFAIQSNYARENAQLVAMLASKGLIHTHEGKNQYGNVWRSTFAGLCKLTQEGIV